jgi:hypothetical protein
VHVPAAERRRARGEVDLDVAGVDDGRPEQPVVADAGIEIRDL